MARVEVRWYAGARAAAGTQSAVVDVPEGAPVADILRMAVGENAELQAVVEVSSLLAGGARIEDRDAPLTHTRLDVLPPFAGG